MGRKKVAFFCCFGAACLLAFFGAAVYRRARLATLPLSPVVVLDAGHGGIDGGVTGKQTGVKESTLNLSVVRLLAEELRGAGITVLFTRDNEGGLYGEATQGFKKRDMYRRRDIIRSAKAAAVISVHMNSCPSCPTRRGAQVFYAPEEERSRALATALQTALNVLSPRAYAPLTGDYFLLRCSETPTVIAECGFLSNAEEELLLQTEAHQRALANSLAKGILLFLGEG